MKNHNPTIKYFDLYGLRKEKGEFLESHDVKNTKWQELELKEPNFWFVPKDTRGEEKYKKFISLTDIFIFYNVGGKPGNDSILVGNNDHELKVKIDQFIQLLKFDKSKAQTEADKNLLRIIDKFEIEDGNLIPYNYRPFDIRQTYYDERIYTRAVPKLKSQFINNNIGLLTTKILKAENFAHVFATNIFPDVIFLSNKTSTNTFVFPLFLYDERNKNQKNIFSEFPEQVNFTNFIVNFLEDNYKTKLFFNNPSDNSNLRAFDIFYYIYGILYSNIYRMKYNEFLKIDFPRIPFTNDFKLFQRIAKIGEKLVYLHLLKLDKIERSGKDIKFPAVGDNKAEKREYKNNRIYINDKQYFMGVTPEVWNYHIGGYQVLDKWLKDRKDKVLSSEDVNHYLKVITALKLTIEAQKKIDKIYQEIEENK